MVLSSAKVFDKKTEYVTHFGKDLGWKIEESEFVNVLDVKNYQTADDVDEDAYPEPLVRFRLTNEKQSASMEETYYWLLTFLRQDLNFSSVEKIYDVFAASESSAMFGNTGQKLSIQQDRASQYLRTIGEMVRTLFTLVRELRIIDERMEMYDNWDKNKSADISLKHLYINLVEGRDNPDSVYNLSRQLNFTILPDLFFNTAVFKLEDIESEIDEKQTKDINKVVRTVLKRKIYLYINWKLKTEKELLSRRNFQLQYLRQHWSVIRLYMSWLKPYLKTSNRLTQSGSLADSPDVINAFDTTRMQIEFLAKRHTNLQKSKTHYSCVLVSIDYKTTPTLTYRQEYGGQSVAHAGKVTFTVRGYAWHDDDIKAYKDMRREEDMAILKHIDEHVAGAFDALGDSLDKYLEEAKDTDAIKRKKEKEEKEKKEQEHKNNEF